MGDTQTRVSVLVTQVSHGFARGTPVRFNGTDWVLAVAGDAGIGLVGDVKSNSVFEYVTTGFVDGLDGLTPGVLYYVNASGSLDTNSSGSLIFRAYTATSGFVLIAGTEASTSSGSTAASGATSASVVAVDTALNAHITNPTGAHASTAISYSNTAYPLLASVGAALDELLFFAMTASISGGYDTEIGVSVATLDLTWSFNKDISAQVLSGTGTAATSLSDRAQTVTGPFTTDTVWTIQGTSLDTTENPTGTTTLRFLNKRYWGVSANTTLTDGQIIALSSELATSRVQSRTLSPSAQYLYFAWPASFSTPSFTVNGLVNTAFSKVRAADPFVNASGATVSYDLWRSDNLLTATYDVGIT